MTDHPSGEAGGRGSPPQPGAKCKLGLECLTLPLRATFPSDPAPQESQPHVLWGVTSQPQQASPDLGSCTQVSRPPRQNLGQSVTGRSDTRPFSLPGGGSALRRWPGTRGGVGAAGGTDAQPPRVRASVEALSETAFPVEAPRSPQTGTDSRSGRCRPKRLSAPQFLPLGWLAGPFHQGPSATTGSEIHGQVQTPRRRTRTCVRIL